MKKFARIFCVIMLTVVLGVSCLTFASCKPNVDDEPEPLVFSIGQTDNVFNPFFHSSAYDSEITGQTQISMLSVDKKGNPICGVDTPSVAQNFRRTVWLNGKPYSTDDPAVQDVNPDNYTADQYYTTYQFLIKNNIKFSDGEDLTIKDVIFNLYTYLDPSYTGTSTMYSTKIRGLQDYRTQVPNADDNKYQGLLRTWNTAATQRIDSIRMAYPANADNIEKNRSVITEKAKEAIIEDVVTIRKMYWDAVVADYNSAVNALDGYIEQNKKEDPENDPTELGFTEVWEVFLYEAGYIKADIDPRTGVIDLIEGDDESYDKYGNKLGIGAKNINYGEYGKYWHDRESLIKFVYNAKMGIFDESGDNNPYGNVKYDENHCIKGSDGEPDRPQEGYGINTDIITEGNGSDNAIGSSLEKNQSDYYDLIWNSSRLMSNLYTILTYSRTANTAREQFVGEARTDYFKAMGGMPVDQIPGVKVLKLENGESFNGEFGETAITDDQYVLQIEVEKVDPQAIFNFGFTVAPMHYYSNADNAPAEAYDESDDYRSFHYPIYKGVENDKGFLTASAEPVAEDKNYNASHGHKFTEGDTVSVGRPFSDLNYFSKVLKASNVLFIPVGAGMYKVASYNLFDENYTPNQRPTFSEFFNNNIAYYVRNPYFYTTSGEGKSPEESSINNCKIKFVRYQVISTSQLLNAVINKTVDYGDPTASKENMELLDSDEAKNKSIVYMKEDNNGYGYIGINARFVPDIQIRKAIMHSMNLNYITDYYGNNASLIYRPISTVSWASPQNEDNAHKGEADEPYYQFDSDGSKYISRLVNEAGYKGAPGTAYKKTANGETRELKYTFTIAGASTDHPAYKMMQEAAKILNKNGFEVKVITDNNALSKLAAGELAVWAAAWSSGVDPDMYQLYHKDSVASSTRNWGYPEILADPGKYPTESRIINELSEKIIQGRTVFNRATRADIYFEAYNMVMELAVELPTYQRKNVYAYNADKIDSSTFLPASERSAYKGPLSEFWKVELKKK